MLLESMGSMLLTWLERELVKHEPEIQEMLIKQLEALSKMIVDFIETKIGEFNKPALEKKEEETPSE